VVADLSVGCMTAADKLSYVDATPRRVPLHAVTAMSSYT